MSWRLTNENVLSIYLECSGRYLGRRLLHKGEAVQSLANEVFIILRTALFLVSGAAHPKGQGHTHQKALNGWEGKLGVYTLKRQDRGFSLRVLCSPSYVVLKHCQAEQLIVYIQTSN